MRNSSKLRNLSIAAMVGLFGLGATNSAQANEFVDTSSLSNNLNVLSSEITTQTRGQSSAYEWVEVSQKTDTSVDIPDIIDGVAQSRYYELNLVKDNDGYYKHIGWGGQSGNTSLADENRNITGNFIENDIAVELSSDGNYGKYANKITADFIGNNYGVYNYYKTTIGDITGDFINNSAEAIHTQGQSSSIDSIKGNFIGNGVAVNLTNGTGLITGNFLNNRQGITNNIYGMDGVAGNYSPIPIIRNSNFINNGSSDGKFYLLGMDMDEIADELGGDIETTKQFLSMYEQMGMMPLGGAAISNITKINLIDNSLFYGNKTVGYGGAIYNNATNNSWLAMIESDVNNNGIYESTLSFKTVNLVENGQVTKTYYSLVTDNKSLSYFLQLIPSGSSDLAVAYRVEAAPYVYNMQKNEVSETIDLDSMTTEERETYLSDLEESLSQGYVSSNKSEALEAYEELTSLHYITFNNTSFINNASLSDDKYGLLSAKGGAIYSAGPVKIQAKNNHLVKISGNYTLNNGVRDDNAIHMATYGVWSPNYELQEILIDYKPSTLDFVAKNGGVIQIDDKISGDNGSYSLKYSEFGTENMAKYFEDSTSHYNVNFKGDSTGAILLNNNIENEPNVSLRKTNLHLGRENVLDGSRLSLHSGNLYTINNQIGTMNLGSLSVLGDTNMYVDVDLAKKQMDRPVVTTYGEHAGNINVAGINLLSDATEASTRVMFAENGLKDNVTTSVSEVAYTPIYKYSVSYDNSGEEGYFVFARSGGGNKADSYNPAVLGSSSTTTVGALGTMNQTFNYAFQNSDNFMNIPYLERVSMKDRNKYALSLTGDATDMGRYSPLYQPSDEGSSVWVKPYATFENVPLKNGPKVSNITYGTLVGFDSEMQSLKRGWDRVWTGYIGYNGASQRYSGIDSTQNGGLIGGTMTLYKGNFFNATTVSVGANVANNQTMYGSEDFAMLLSGIGNKTGYNFEFKGGKCILQPSLLMSYTFVNTFDYTNAAGVRIDNKPLHALQLAPGVKVIGNLKGGWQPYASVSMVWNLMGESDATANGVKLPEMSIKPYVQYGVGLQKRIKDHFMAYGQAMVQNGGRNGVSLTAGFRWAIGHDCKYKNQKVDAKKQDKISSSNEILRSAQNDRGKCIGHYEERSDVVISSNNEIATPLARNDRGRKILKQMTPAQRAAYGGKYYNTSRTAKSGSLRQY